MRYFILILSILTFVSCKNESETKQVQTTTESGFKDQLINDTVRDCAAYYKAAAKMDSILLKSLEIENNTASEALRTFVDFAFYCESDTMSPVYLIKAAQVAMSINNTEQARIVLDRCINNYPRFKNKPAALFLLAQLYDEPRMLNDEAEARKLYEQIVYDYPKSDWAASAKAALQLIGKTDEQILEEFKKKNKGK